MSPEVTETAIVALATFFATIGPLDVAAVFAALTVGMPPWQRRNLALRGSLVAVLVLLPFALFGERLLGSFGISLPALRTAGGILLFLIGVDMVFARHSGSTSTTAEEEAEASDRSDIAVFPLGTPLIAGPGAMGAVILLMADTGGDLVLQGVVLAGLAANLLLTLVLLLMAAQVQGLLGITGMQVIARVFGVLLCALAVQFVFDGIEDSGLLETGAG